MPADVVKLGKCKLGRGQTDAASTWHAAGTVHKVAGVGGYVPVTCCSVAQSGSPGRFELPEHRAPTPEVAHMC